MVSRSLYRVEGSTYLPGPLTRGGWSDDAQHGSPPAGILGRAIESVPTAVAMQTVRLTVDLFRPVPLRPLEVETTILRDGRRIQVVEATVRAGETLLGRATGLKIRTTELVGIGGQPEGPLEPSPHHLPVLDWRGAFGDDGTLERFHTDGVEIRTVDDSFVRRGAGRTWFRLNAALVEGEPVTPLQRMAIMSDLANGNSQSLDPREWLFVNPDITLYVERLPGGEWIGMSSAAHQHPTGVGVTSSVLYDLRGRVGVVNQAQLLQRRDEEAG